MSDLTTINPEALKLIQDTAVAASGAENKVKLIEFDDQSERGPRFFSISEDGFEEIPTRDPIRNTQLVSIREIEAFVTWAQETLDAHPTVWINDRAVHVNIHDTPNSDRNDSGFVPLTPTKAFEFLKSAASKSEPQQFGHKEFLQLFRRRFDGCLPDGSKLLETLQKISFSNAKRGRSEIGKDRSSYGLEIDNKLNTEFGELPDTIVLSVRLYEDPALVIRREIECAIEADAETLTFALYPLAEEIEHAETAEREQIRQLLSNLTVPVFEGTP